MIEHALAAPAADPRPGTPIVEVTDLTKAFGATKALRGVTLTIREGESHGLLGRNGAGKSTLVSMLTGLHAPDRGAIRFQGAPAPALSDRAGWRSNVACVYQHRTLVPQLSVAENLFLGQAGRWVNWRNIYSKAAALLDDWDLPVSPRRQVDQLGVGEAQMVEIARALAQGSRFVILDEPTAQLVTGEIDNLIERVNALRDRGVTFLFISHHLDEVPQVCDTVTVLRNGQDVLHAPVEGLSTNDMVTAMVGEEGHRDRSYHAATFNRDPDKLGPVVLELDQLETPPLTAPYSLHLRAGEVVGLAGHAGSGCRDIALAITGHGAAPHGSMKVDCTPVARRWDSQTAVRAGVTLVPEDRIKTGLVGQMTIEDNLTFTILRQLSKGPLLNLRERRAAAEAGRTQLDIASAGVSQRVDQLSGGNQQKVLLGAALAPKPKVLVLMHPTAGVDIASKSTIMEIVERHRSDGLAVVLVSDEPEELQFCDRVHVFVRGSFVAETHHARADELVALMEGSTPTTGKIS